MKAILPKEGTLFTKDRKLKLEYECRHDDQDDRIFHFKVYGLKSWEGIKRNYHRNNKPPCIMSERELVNYLYSEGYIDEKD